jgi:allene oxide cyclase
MLTDSPHYQVRQLLGINDSPEESLMTRLILILGTLVSFLAGPIAIAGEQIHLVERALSDTIVHAGGKDDVVGNLLTFANPLFDAANKTQLGTDQGFCIRVAAGKSWECMWTAMLAGGQITVEGPFLDQGDSSLAVTGGTGKYVGAKGIVKLHSRDAKGTAYDFHYELQ